jgi:hypothetical protein
MILPPLHQNLGRLAPAIPVLRTHLHHSTLVVHEEGVLGHKCSWACEVLEVAAESLQRRLTHCASYREMLLNGLLAWTPTFFSRVIVTEKVPWRLLDLSSV